MKELFSLLICLALITMGIVLIYKNMISHSEAKIKDAVAVATAPNKERLDSLLTSFSLLMKEMQSDNENFSELKSQNRNLKALIDEQEFRKRELEENNEYMSNINVDLKRSNTELVNKAGKLRDEIQMQEDTINDMEEYIDSLEKIKTGLEIAVNNIVVEEIPYLSRPVYSLGLTPSIEERIRRCGIVYIGDMINVSEDYITDIWGVGPATMEKITRKLKENGVWFGMDVIRVDDRWYKRKK